MTSFSSLFTAAFNLTLKRGGKPMRAFAAVALTLVSATASAQWAPLTAPGQSTLATAKSPSVLAVAKTARILAVGTDNTKEVAFFNPDTGASLGKVTLPKAALALALTDSGSRAYALFDDKISVAVINTATRVVENTWKIDGAPADIGNAMVLNEIRNELLIADGGNKRVIAVTPTTGSILRTQTFSKAPDMIALGGAQTGVVGSLLVGFKQGDVAVLDAITFVVARTVNVGQELKALSWWPGQGGLSPRALAIAKNQDALALIEPTTGAITRVPLVDSPDKLSVEQKDDWAYLAAKNADIVHVADLVKRSLSGYYTLPGAIGQLVFDEAGGFLFVTLSNDDKILKLDFNQASIIAAIGVQKTLKDVAVNNLTHEAATVSDKDTEFAKIKLADRSVTTLSLPVKADKLALDVGLNIAVVADSGNKIAFVNLAATPPTAHTQRVDLDGSIQAMAVDSSRHLAVVVVSGKDQIRLIDTATRAEVAQIQTTEKYDAVGIHEGKGIAYLATQSKKLALLNLASKTISQSITLGFKVEAIAVDSVLNRAVLTTFEGDKAWVLDLNTLQMIGSVTLPKEPGAVAIQADTHIAVIASTKQDTISLLDVASLAVTPNFNRLTKPAQLAVSTRYNQVLVVSADKNDLLLVQLPNVVPTLTSVSPSSALTTAGTITLTVTGAHFVDGAVVVFGSTTLVTTWVSPTQLTATVPAALLVAGTVNVRVLNPVPGGGYSPSQTFTITTPILPPTLDQVSPTTVIADGVAKTFTFTGTNFTAPVLIVVGTQEFPATTATLTSATVTLPASLFMAPGTLNLAIKAAGSVTTTKLIELKAPTPTLTAVAPTTLATGNTSQTITLTGTNFYAPVKVRFDGVLIDAVVTSQTQATATIPAAQLASARTVQVSVEAAGGMTASLSVTITAPTPAPFVYTSAPATILAVGQPQVLTLAGQDFVSGAVVVVGTETFAASFVSSQQIKVTLPATLTSMPRTLAIIVKNPDGKTSNAYQLPVVAPDLLVATIAPTSGTVGTSVVIYGTGFSPTAADNRVVFAGNVQASVSAATTTQLTVTVPNGAATGVVQITVGGRTASSPSFTVGATPVEDFSFGTNAAEVMLYQGSSASADVRLDNAGTSSFQNLAKLSVSTPPVGITATFTRPYLLAGSNASLIIEAAATATVGITTLTITATGDTVGGTATKTTTIRVDVRARANVTGIKGRFVDEKGMGIGGILARVGTTQAQTDSAGNFLITGLTAGDTTVRFDATPAHPLYPIWPYSVKLEAGSLVTIPDWVIKAPPADEKFVAINNMAADQIVTDPRFPGLEIKLPAGVSITGYDGIKKTRLAVERHDPDRSPTMPPPVATKSLYQLYFGTPMGGIPSAPIPVTLPNETDLEPGDQTDIWFFDGSPMGGDGAWKVAGRATVSADGKTISMNPGQGISRFCGVCGLLCVPNPLPTGAPPPPPPCTPPAPSGSSGGGGGAGGAEPPSCKLGNPVQLSNGQESPIATDLSLGGLVPISLTRYYNPVDAFNNKAGTVGSIGYGWGFEYDIALLPFAGPQKRIIMPGNIKVNFLQQPDGLTFRNATDFRFQGAVLRQISGTEWRLEMSDKSTWKFQTFAGITGNILGGVPLFLVEQRQPDGKVISIGRLPNGRVTTVGTTERGVAMTYGANGFISEITDPINRKVRFTYNAADRVETVTNPENGVTRYEYGPFIGDYPITVPNVAGNNAVCVQFWNESNDPALGLPLKSIKYPGTVGRTVNTLGYGGRVLRQVLADGSEYRFSYTIVGGCIVGNPGTIKPMQTCTAAADSCVQSHERAQRGEHIIGGTVAAVSVTDPKGRVTTHRFDPQGAASAQTNQQGQSAQYTRDSVGRIIKSVDLLGRVYQTSFDANGNVSRTIDTLGRVTNVSYHPQWNKPLTVTRYLADGTPITSTRQYDATTGNLLRSTDPEGNATQFVYNARGQVTEITNPLGHKTRLEYNAAGDVVKTIDPLLNEVLAEPDLAGRAIKLTDPLMHITRIERNGLDQTTKIIDANLGETRMAYNAKHQIASITDPLNQTIERYDYDDMSRPIRRTDASLVAETVNYDPMGLVSSSTDRKGQVISSTYDEKDRPLTTTYADGTTLTRQYDAVGRLIKLTRGSESIRYTYDIADRVTQLIVTANGRTDTITNQYDHLDRMVSRSVNGEITTYLYDKASRLKTITHRGQTTSYLYDAASRLTQKTLPNGVTQTMGYDEASRLLSLTYKKTTGEIIEQLTYTYDARGQQLTKTTTNPYPEAAESIYAATYDAANRMTSITTKGTGAPATAGGAATDETFTFTYDANGNMAQKKKPDNTDTTTFTWDSQNRLTGLTRTGATSLTAAFKYDMFNRRIEKTINGSTVKFIYDGEQVVGEIKSDGTSTSLLAGLAIDEMIARYANGQQSTYLTDALGSVIAQLKDDQTIRNQYGYSPYGMTVKGQNGTADAAIDDQDNTSQYTGRENDGTGLYYYRARYYDPQGMRFISEDPIGTDGGANVYAYVDGDPINKTDPSGELALVGALVGGLGNLGYQLYKNGGSLSCVNLWEVGSWALMGSGAGLVGRAGVSGVGNFLSNGDKFTKISQKYWAARGGANGMSLDHWAISQAAGRSGAVSPKIVNGGWNLLEMPRSWNTWLGFAPNWGGTSAALANVARVGVQTGVVGTAAAAGYAGYQIETNALQSGCICK